MSRPRRRAAASALFVTFVIVVVAMPTMGDRSTAGDDGTIVLPALAGAVVVWFLIRVPVRWLRGLTGPSPIRYIRREPIDVTTFTGAAMHHKTFFRLAIKAIGIWLAVQGGLALVAMAIQLGLAGARGMPASFWTASLLAPEGARLIIGLYLFFGGELVVRLAFPSNRPYCPDCGYDIAKLTEGRCPECGCSLVATRAEAVAGDHEAVG